jgi:hypothetical protein
MSNTIRAAIVKQLINGVDVAVAYRQAASEAADALASHIDRGNELEEALASLGVANVRKVAADIRSFGAVDHYNMYMIVSGGGVASVPDATCVAERLRDKQSPTREDVEKAFAACASAAGTSG